MLPVTTDRRLPARDASLLEQVAPNALHRRGFARGPGFDGSFYRFMFGPKYFFTPNIYGRAAFVADWYDGTRSPAGDLPFDDGQRTHQQVLAFDVIATF